MAYYCGSLLRASILIIILVFWGIAKGISKFHYRLRRYICFIYKKISLQKGILHQIVFEIKIVYVLLPKATHQKKIYTTTVHCVNSRVIYKNVYSSLSSSSSTFHNKNYQTWSIFHLCIQYLHTFKLHILKKIICYSEYERALHFRWEFNNVCRYANTMTKVTPYLRWKISYHRKTSFTSSIMAEIVVT